MQTVRILPRGQLQSRMFQYDKKRVPNMLYATIYPKHINQIIELKLPVIEVKSFGKRSIRFNQDLKDSIGTDEYVSVDNMIDNTKNSLEDVGVFDSFRLNCISIANVLSK